MQSTNNQKITSDQVFYDQEPIGSAADHESWMREIRTYFNMYADTLNSRLAGTNGKIAELGAGSCGLSVCLSGLSNVKHVTAVDISMARMQKMIGKSVNILGGEISKIEPLASDFNSDLPFEDGSLDAIFFDAALHHSRAIWHLLSECHRVLNKGGLLIAQRESYLSPLRARKQLANLLKTPEVAANVSENMYLLAQYEYYLRVNGFDVRFNPCSASRLKQYLKVFNGSVFCDGVIWCEKH